MTTHLRLTRVVGPALSTNRKDVLSVKTALNRLGLFHDPEHGITPFPEPRMFESIKRFQRAQGLAVDGVMRRRGPTLEALNKVLVRNDVMRDIRPRTGPPPRAVAGGVGLKGPLMSNAAADPDDVVKMKSALAHLGLFDDPEFGITPLPDRGLFEGIRKFHSDLARPRARRRGLPPRPDAGGPQRGVEGGGDKERQTSNRWDTDQNGGG